MWKRRNKKPPVSRIVGPPSREARTAAKWWADQLRELKLYLEPLRVEDFTGMARSKITRVNASIDYDMSRVVVRALTEANISKFEQSLAMALQAELERFADFSCYWQQRDKYHIDDLLAPHLKEAGIPTDRAVTQPIFHPSMVTVISKGKVVAHGGIIATNVVINESLSLVS